MNMEKLRLILEIFESKVTKLEEDYREKNKDKFSEERMKKYINRKLKREIQIINYLNIVPSVEILKISENFKY